MNIIYSLPGLLIAIIFHELAHGYTAYLLGDHTAKDAGRLSLNPINHIDPIGLLCMVIFKFGWAKPVPVNSRNFQNRKKGMILVSLAGPFTNFIIALFMAVVLNLIPIKNIILFEIILITMWYNIMLGVFNLLPFPPLDGSKILASLLPTKLEILFYKYEKYMYFVLILLIFTNSINSILSPVIEIIINIFNRILMLI